MRYVYIVMQNELEPGCDTVIGVSTSKRRAKAILQEAIAALPSHSVYSASDFFVEEWYNGGVFSGIHQAKEFLA